MCRAGFAPRHRGHDSQNLGTSKFTVDKCHARMRKFGPHNYLLMPISDGGSLALTTHLIQLAEVRSFVLLRVTMNAQHQTPQGMPQARVVA